MLIIAASLIGSPSPAQAATGVVSDEASCEAVFAGAVWNASSSFCTLPSGTSTVATADAVEVVSPAALVINQGGALAVDGELVVRGRLLLRGGDLNVNGTMVNRGFWDVRSTSEVTIAASGRGTNTNQLQLLEGARLTNAGAMENTGSVSVKATFVNDGTLDTTGGTFRVDCQQGDFINNGTFSGSVDEDICFVGTGVWNDPTHWTTGVVPGNVDAVDVRGRATINHSVVRSEFTRVSGQLVVASGGHLTVSTDGVIETLPYNPSFDPRLAFAGTVNNHGTISNNGAATVDGLLSNYGEFTRTSVNTSLTIGGVVFNHSAGRIEGGLDVLAGGTLTNVGDVLLTKSQNSNAGMIENSPVATFTLHNSLDNMSGGQLLNRGEIHLEHALSNPPVLDNGPGAVLLNDVDAFITVDATSSLVNRGNVENRHDVANDGSVRNTGSWCGPGSVGPAGVTGSAPVASCLPRIDLGAHRAIDEGTALTLADTFHDPGVPTSFTASIDWDDGLTSTGALTQVTLVSQRITASHIYRDNGQFEVEAFVCDEASCASDVVGVTVRNVPPTVSVDPVAPTGEGSATVIGFSASDSGADDVLQVPSDGIACGVGGSLVNGSLSFDGAIGSFSCVFADGPSAPTVAVTVADDDGAETTAMIQVAVENVPPTITSIDVPEAPVAVGAQVTVHAPFTDPGADTFTSAFSWGDGSATAGLVTGNTAQGDHNYPSAGLYLVTATVTDDDGGSDTRSADDSVVVYDPDSILTIGATYDSPAGTFLSDSDRSAALQVTARVRYPKEAAAPAGRLTVRERGDVLVEATAFDWLVVSSPTSFAMGSAEWMGSPGATFLLSVQAGDKAEGRVRLQVWDSGGTRVYDSAPGAGLFSDPTTSITRGAITAT